MLTADQFREWSRIEDLPPEAKLIASHGADVAEDNARLRAAIAEHHAQKADDRCWMDDDKLYAAAGLPPADRRVGDNAAMLDNCRRFITNRCQGGGWESYRELEEEAARLRAALEMIKNNGVEYSAVKISKRIASSALAGADVRDESTLQAVACGRWKPAEKTT